MTGYSDSASRLALAQPLKTPKVFVRQLTTGDTHLLLQAAAEVAFVKGALSVPGSVEEAATMLGEWERLRVADRGNLFGAFLPDASRMMGVMSLCLTDDFVAEGAAWSRSDSSSRKTVVAGLNEVVRFAHRQMRLLRIWVEVDPMDPFTRFLSTKAGFSRETDVRAPDGSVRHRYSSIG